MRRKDRARFGMEQQFWMAITILTILLECIKAEWTDPLGQYHIQTDEGPERYFRYQTQSGQYRKEKRLEDGTVIGTYAWIDADGFLRQRDYIADNEGYRILRTKNVQVGFHTPIEQAIKAAKKAPAENGVLVETSKLGYSSTSNAPSSTTQRPSNSYIPSYPNSVSNVDIRPNSYPYELPAGVSTTISPPITSNDIYNDQNSIHYTSTPIPILSSTPSLNQEVSTTPAPNIVYSSNPQYEHYSNPYINHNGPTYPIDTHGHTFNGQNNKIGNGYDPQYPEYDGVSVTNDGFRYYIPRAYHEEQQLPGNQKSGSFGYVDPFGIRRVIYYNASPEGGFQHRKNNRYVGLHATPYDPRPY
ncbi:uncharacterized protein [Onthophagus taurus]|uniref:uncharacterized protein n=1 Tax=Onthophagus taurus TaxID=166361 RepID=UPI000C201B77|nr:uncharacterized protein LOC111428003 [Onthophagus taurus]